MMRDAVFRLVLPALFQKNVTGVDCWGFVFDGALASVLAMRAMKGFYVYWLTFSLLFGGLGSFVRAGNDSLPDVVQHTSISIVDIEGEEQVPFRVGEAKGAALFFVTHDCPISNAYAPELERLRKEYGAKGFSMMLVYVDPDVTKKELRQHMKDYSLSDYTAVFDDTHALVKETGATITPEAVVVLRDGSIAYRGRIDNLYPSLGQRRRVITEMDLRGALNAILENRNVEAPRTQAVGCYIPNL
ncbi:MAG: redoxin family protein [Opitutales bacterium]